MNDESEMNEELDVSEILRRSGIRRKPAKEEITSEAMRFFSLCESAFNLWIDDANRGIPFSRSRAFFALQSIADEIAAGNSFGGKRRRVAQPVPPPSRTGPLTPELNSPEQLDDYLIGLGEQFARLLFCWRRQAAAGVEFRDSTLLKDVLLAADAAQSGELPAIDLAVQMLNERSISHTSLHEGSS